MYLVEVKTAHIFDRRDAASYQPGTWHVFGIHTTLDGAINQAQNYLDTFLATQATSNSRGEVSGDDDDSCWSANVVDNYFGDHKPLLCINIRAEPLRQPEQSIPRRPDLYVDDPEAERQFARQLAEGQGTTTHSPEITGVDEEGNEEETDVDDSTEEAPAKRRKGNTAKERAAQLVADRQLSQKIKQHTMRPSARKRVESPLPEEVLEQYRGPDGEERLRKYISSFSH